MCLYDNIYTQCFVVVIQVVSLIGKEVHKLKGQVVNILGFVGHAVRCNLSALSL